MLTDSRTQKRAAAFDSTGPQGATLAAPTARADTFEERKVSLYFPTPIWFHKLPKSFYESFNRDVVALLQAKLGTMDAGQGPGMWQTQTDLQKTSPFNRLVPSIQDAAAGALKFLDAEFEQVAVTSMWVNISGPRAHHRLHTHPNNFLSGVYYINVGRGSDLITFADPRPQAHVFHPRYRRPNDFNMGLVNLRVETGMLVLFPAYLAHSVPPNASSDPRISLAFNIMTKDSLAQLAGTEWQGNIRI